ncbi:hypothetical protein [Bradyrhizobium sp. DOA9]|uniref:hypothetical protein n=1 Tax=Bradyrhizobium sp. DOA9 TaxID=1126627 RepID=UPI000468E554|nr:hypothetical protein [Bradyrhizobium sp. DOA9]GAJ35421.1 hypothetical protein BDOA9_0146270 [Bradyrhizobium sp. DOA9]
MTDTPKFGFFPGRRDRDRTFLEMVRVEGIFQSAAAKLEWANRHIAELDRQSSEHLKATCTFRLQRSGLAGGTRMLFNAPYSVPLRFGLMIGDVANNLRSTLDHIAWKVTSRHVPDENLQRKIQYPFPGKNGLQQAIKSTFLIRAGDEAVKIVEKYSDAINGLDQLNNGDKHRLTTPLSQVAEIRGSPQRRPRQTTTSQPTNF